MDGTLAGELTVLATALLRLAREDRRTRDFTLNSLRQALSEVVASFPVYRTYIVDKPSAQDRKFIDWAIGRARRRSLAADASVFDFLRQVLLGKPLPGAPAGLGERYRAFARRLQQYTAPVAAKGIEDTALYRHHRLISVNDVGGEPDDFGISVAAFHAASRDRAQHWPHTMLATSTHDAKRSRGRARAHRRDQRDAGGLAADGAALEPAQPQPQAHRRRRARRRRATTNTCCTRRWSAACRPGRSTTPHWPTTPSASTQAMLKSVRESKAVTSWINPNEAYEAALSGFIEALLTRRENYAVPRRPADQRGGVRLVRRAQRPHAGGDQRPVARRARLSTRATRRSSCRWSIPTTGGRSTTTRRRAMLDAGARDRRPSPTARRALREMLGQRGRRPRQVLRHLVRAAAAPRARRDAAPGRLPAARGGRRRSRAAGRLRAQRRQRLRRRRRRRGCTRSLGLEVGTRAGRRRLGRYRNRLARSASVAGAPTCVDAISGRSHRRTARQAARRRTAARLPGRGTGRHSARRLSRGGRRRWR